MSQLRETQPTDHDVPSELLGPGEEPGPAVRLPRTVTPDMRFEAPAGEIVHTSLGVVFKTPAGTVHRIEWFDPEQPAADVVVLRSDSGEHAIVETGQQPGRQPVAPVAVRPLAGSPIGILGLAQSALDALTEPDDEFAELDLDGAQLVAARLARFGVRGIPGSCLMHPVVEHVLRLTDAEQVRIADDGRALTISKFGVSAIVPLPAAVADFVTEYDGPDLFPYPGLYAVPSMVYSRAG